MRDDPIVVTGVGAITSLGLSVAETWNGLLAGENGIRPIESFNVGGFACKVAAQVRGLDAAALGVYGKAARIMDTHSFMLLKCVRDAFAEAHLDVGSVTEEEVGFFAGMGMVDYRIDDLVPAVAASRRLNNGFDIDAFYSAGYEAIYPLIILYNLNNVSLCQAAIDLKVRGANAVFSPHADAGAYAIAEAVESLVSRESRVALAGGVSEKISPFGLARAHLKGILNTDAESVATLRPFSAERRGTVLGEGCGILALELRSSADERGVPYTAMITGRGFAFGCERDSFTPTVAAMARSMRLALDSANLSPAGVDVLIAHGDGTRGGDRNEIQAIAEVFADCLDGIIVFSSKGALGHLLAGAPAVDLIIGTSMLSCGVVPATYNCVPLDERVKFRVITERPAPTSPRRLLVNCRSDEGQSASLILETVLRK